MYRRRLEGLSEKAVFSKEAMKARIANLKRNLKYSETFSRKDLLEVEDFDKHVAIGPGGRLFAAGDVVKYADKVYRIKGISK